MDKTELKKEVFREQDCMSFVMKRSCVWQAHVSKGAQQSNFSLRMDMKQIDFVLVGKNIRKYLKDVR